MVEPDFAPGTAIDLKDCYFRLAPHDNFDISIGQMKRRFDLFELTSSTQMLVIERDGRIGRTKVQSYSFLTEELQFSDRDQGVFLSAHTDNDRVRVEGAVTNGVKANTRPILGAKAFQGRVSFEPVKDTDLALHAGLSVRPYRSIATPMMAPPDTSTSYAPAFEISAELGNFNSGPHVQAGFVSGTNPTTYDGGTDDADSFLAFQVIGSYKHAFANKKWFEAIEPLVRFSYADPDTDEDADGGADDGGNRVLMNRFLDLLRALLGIVPRGLGGFLRLVRSPIGELVRLASCGLARIFERRFTLLVSCLSHLNLLALLVTVTR